MRKTTIENNRFEQSPIDMASWDSIVEPNQAEAYAVVGTAVQLPDGEAQKDVRHGTHDYVSACGPGLFETHASNRLERMARAGQGARSGGRGAVARLMCVHDSRCC
jgi:hypothetical protein